MNFDPDVVLGMVFTVVMMLLVGGFLVAIPIIRRLGKLTDEWVRSRREGLPGENEWTRLTDHLESIGAEATPHPVGCQRVVLLSRLPSKPPSRRHVDLNLA